MRLALFDLDGTLTPLDTENEWITALATAGLVDARPHAQFHADYLAGHMDGAAYLAWYTGVLATLAPRAIGDIGAQVVARVLQSIDARRRAWIEEERAKSDAVLLVSATNRFLVEPIGRALLFDDVLASPYRMRGGRFTGTLEGEYNLGPAKHRTVTRWLGERGTTWADLTRCSCYADSINDLALLEASSVPVVVDPGAALARIAEQRGWLVTRTVSDT
jgi:HAD superfamily hydrolase (TIGR01490 family)